MSAATKQKPKSADPALMKLQREWNSWSNDRLQKALEKGLRNIASSIREIATALGILESRGQTPKCVGYSRIFSILRRVYRGDTTADIVTRFFGNSPFLYWVTGKPLDYQMELAEMTDNEVEKIYEDARGPRRVNMHAHDESETEGSVASANAQQQPPHIVSVEKSEDDSPSPPQHSATSNGRLPECNAAAPPASGISAASIGDAAESILSIIRQHSQPAALAAKILPVVRDLAGKRGGM